jgi:HAMP domain-containing protein
MILVVLTVVVISLLIAVLAIFLYVIGRLLNRTANNLDDCSQNVKNIAYHAEAIRPGVTRINETGTTVIGALPLLCEAAERIGIAKSAPYYDPSDPPFYTDSSSESEPAAAPAAAPPAAPSPAPAPATHKAPPAAPAPAPAIPARSGGVGYLDDEDRGGHLGYLDT